MPYDSSALTIADATDLTWALAWTRWHLRDTDNNNLLHADEELAALNTAHAWTNDNVVYYRPHQTAAALVESDPDRATNESLMGASISNRGPGAIAASIRKAGRWMDDLIGTTAGARPPSGGTLTPVF